MIYIVCHSDFEFILKPLFTAVNMSKFKDERVQFRKSGLKELKVKYTAVITSTVVGYL